MRDLLEESNTEDVKHLKNFKCKFRCKFNLFKMESDKKQPSTYTKKPFLSKNALAQIVAVSIKNLLLLAYGMTLGFPTILIPSLSKANAKDAKFSLEQEGISWIGSISMICVPFGCLLSGVLTQPIGRKRSMQFLNIPLIFSWLLFYFSTEMWHVFLALIITGLAGGLLEAPVLTYVAEVTQPHLRGVLSSTSSMSVIGGSMIQFILGTMLDWRTVALCSVIVPIMSITFLFFIPETPIWLVTKKRYDEAKASLAWLRGWATYEEIEEEYQAMIKGMGIKQNTSDYKNNHITNGNNSVEYVQPIKKTRFELLEMFGKRTFIQPFILVVVAFLLSHFCGLTPLVTYSITIFSALNAPINSYYATAILGVIQLSGCIVCVSIVRTVGKRVIVFVSLFGSGFCFLVVSIYAYKFNYLYLDNSLRAIKSNVTISATNIDEGYSWIPITFLIASSFTASLGIRILPWILTGEVFPNEIRALASGLAATSSYIFGFLSNKTFLAVVSKITLPGTFSIFSGASFAGILVLYFILPETEGKSLHDIYNHYSGNIELGNKVYRKKKDKDRKAVQNGADNPGFEDNETRNESHSNL